LADMNIKIDIPRAEDEAPAELERIFPQASLPMARSSRPLPCG